MLNFLAVLALMGVALSVVPVHAQQDYPIKPIRIVVPFAPGGTPDTLARIVGQHLTNSWGQPVLVDNRAGSNASIGTDVVAKAAPDGYTLLSASTVHVTTPLVMFTPYDPIRDFSPIATLGVNESVMAMNPSVGVADLREFIALAKAKPGHLAFGSSGNGSGELFSIAAGIKILNVPYKGVGQAVTDLLNGQIQVYIAPASNFIAHAKAGKLKLLAISGQNRSPAIPQVPTFTEAGLPNFDFNQWYGILGPAGLPREIVAKLSTEIAAMLALPDVRQKLSSPGTNPLISTPERFTALIKADSAKLATIFK